jgi:hypothetical protein
MAKAKRAPKAVKPAKPITCPSDAAWGGLANRAKIPSEPSNRKRFRRLLSEALYFAHIPDVRIVNKFSAAEVEELVRIAELADQLYGALDRGRAGKDPVRYILEHALVRGSMSNMHALRNALSKAVTDAKALTRRRPIKDDVSRLCKFLALVLSAVDEAGGKLTFDKNHHRDKENIKPGNLLPFLDKLRRYLPQDFLPRDHPISLYSRVKKDWSLIRANRTEIPA